jgi:hypothetical protein
MFTNQAFTRRRLLQSSACGFGYLALADLLRQQARADYENPLAPKPAHLRARAKHVIFLYMRGGPAQQDTFDYKPQLAKDDGEAKLVKSRKLLASPWKFAQHGKSGHWVSDLLPETAKHADKLCLLKGMHTDVPNHTEAMVQLHTGSFQFVRPSTGAWVLYGLGTENQNLPGFISIKPPVINGGPQNYGSAFLPAAYQGTPIGDIKSNMQDVQIGNIANSRLPPSLQRKQLDMIQAMNRDLLRREQAHAELEGIIESYELAFRMQADVPKVTDLSTESAETLALYGIDDSATDDFGRQCLLARRFVESGVRYVELCHEFWDQHTNLRKGHEEHAKATDKPIAGLLADLERRGLLDETLVVWGGEFGRTADCPKRDGRDHNAKGYCMWLAGGGVKPGISYGATDEYGAEAVENRTHLHDLHATMLHLLGLDHTKLTYRYAGRDFRLTDVHGRVVSEIIA